MNSIIASIIKIGNSGGIILDASVLRRARLKIGDQVEVTVVSQTGTVLLTPIRATIGPKDAAFAAKRLIKKNSSLFKRLA